MTSRKCLGWTVSEADSQSFLCNAAKPPQCDIFNFRTDMAVTPLSDHDFQLEGQFDQLFCRKMRIRSYACNLCICRRDPCSNKVPICREVRKLRFVTE